MHVKGPPFEIFDTQGPVLVPHLFPILVADNGRVFIFEAEDDLDPQLDSEILSVRKYVPIIRRCHPQVVVQERGLRHDEEET